MRHSLALILGALILAGPAPLLAQGVSGEDYGVITGPGLYRTCLERLASDPDGAFDMASEWRDRGGGVPARHCTALALIELGHPGEGAARLDELASDPGAGGAVLRAEILAQAGNAWLMEGEAGRAINSLTTAMGLEVGPETLALLTFDRGRAYALSGEFAEAAEDFTAVLALHPRFVEALVLRANALRAVGDFVRAREDVVAALTLAPEDPHALFEKGALDYLQGDTVSARTALVRSLALAPDGAVADAARAVLEKIEHGE
ncbi:MAG: tetratricopeptide repeat protein [Alphaproteobacteria bacterium]|nr:tetratricopeptide repeat protein [Alphaproteobacteria bacterium]